VQDRNPSITRTTAVKKITWSKSRSSNLEYDMEEASNEIQATDA
jgi:hypothetical protein